MSGQFHDISFEEPIGLFPLPNAVLLPQATLPLQIFEPRYRAMVRDALADRELIAMALLRPGYEPYYYTNRADIHPMVCVGRIREHVRVPDGRYLVNLVGVCRARIRNEYSDCEYRLAMLDPAEPSHPGIDADGEYAARRQLGEFLAAPDLDRIGDIERLRAEAQSDGTLAALTDHAAALLLPPDKVELRQRLLEEEQPLARAGLLLATLRITRRIAEAKQRGRRPPLDGPSLN